MDGHAKSVGYFPRAFLCATLPVFLLTIICIFRSYRATFPRLTLWLSIVIFLIVSAQCLLFLLWHAPTTGVDYADSDERFASFVITTITLHAFHLVVITAIPLLPATSKRPVRWGVAALFALSTLGGTALAVAWCPVDDRRTPTIAWDKDKNAPVWDYVPSTSGRCPTYAAPEVWFMTQAFQLLLVLAIAAVAWQGNNTNMRQAYAPCAVVVVALVMAKVVTIGFVGAEMIKRPRAVLGEEVVYGRESKNGWVWVVVREAVGIFELMLGVVAVVAGAAVASETKERDMTIDIKEKNTTVE